MDAIPYIMTPHSISVVIDGGTKVIPNSHPNFNAIREAIKTQDWSAIPSLIDIPKAVAKFGAGYVEVFDDVVTYKGEALANPICDRILRMMAEGFDIQPMVKFLENVMLNPARSAVQELYLFLEANGIPITSDGHFLAYKKVRTDYLDHHSGKFDNSVGKVLKMERNRVDEDRHNTCSYGFHVCSLAYLPHYGGDNHSSRVMIVKVNPANVVAVPADYDNAKMRVSEYDVVGEYTGDWNKDAFDKVVVDDYESEPCGDEELDDYTVRLVALDEEGGVHYGFVTVEATGEEDAKERALDPVDGSIFEGADIDYETVKAVSATLVI